MIKSEAGTDYSAACSFENGDLNGRIFQNKLRRDRARIVALDDLLILNVRAVGCREANRQSAPLQNMCDQTRVPSSCRSFR